MKLFQGKKCAGKGISPASPLGRNLNEVSLQCWIPCLGPFWASCIHFFVAAWWRNEKSTRENDAMVINTMVLSDPLVG